jgi:hypothetical protein
MSQSGSLEAASVFGHSSNVELFLLAGNQSLKLAQIGPSFVTLREPAELPPGDAEILMKVDGRERRWSVSLTHGSVPFDLNIETVDRQ